MTHVTTVKDLQQMLRAIALADPEQSEAVEPDGVYGDSTARAVAKFQSARGLPVTGVADEATHAAIVEEYNQIRELIGPAQACVIHFPAALSIAPGQSHSHVYLAQAMLLALQPFLGSLRASPVTGTLDEDTAKTLRHIQRCAGLPETGTLDKATWNRLCMLYRAMLDRYHAPSQG